MVLSSPTSWKSEGMGGWEGPATAHATKEGAGCATWARCPTATPAGRSAALAPIQIARIFQLLCKIPGTWRRRGADLAEGGVP